MITKFSSISFKSLEKVEVELGRLNVFVGANGSGKSNLLEAIGVLSAAADGKVTDQTLKQRGVRPGTPELYKSAFPVPKGKRAPAHINFSASSEEAKYTVTLQNPIENPNPAWRFKHELLECGNEKLASRSPSLKNNPNTEIGLAALKAIELQENDPALALLRRLQSYVIYTPTTPVLRGVAPEYEQSQPLGLSGGRLPDAVLEFLMKRHPDDASAQVVKDVLDLIDWAKSYGATFTSQLPLSPSVGSSPKAIRFTDRYMKPSRNVLSGYDASEGALFVLFLAVIAAHPKVPSFCAIDNADHGLNPRLATVLMERFSQWILNNPDQRQILMTSHNPAVLDGLPLQDDRVRLFTVDRDNKGKTVVNRIVVGDRLKKLAVDRGWPLSRLWMNKLIGGMPDV